MLFSLLRHVDINLRGVGLNRAPRVRYWLELLPAWKEACILAPQKRMRQPMGFNACHTSIPKDPIQSPMLVAAKEKFHAGWAHAVL